MNPRAIPVAFSALSFVGAFLTEEDRKAGFITVPADLLKKTGRLQVWLIGEHPLGRLRQSRTISTVE